MTDAKIPQCILHTAKIEQILTEISEIKAEMKEIKADEKEDRKQFWTAINQVRDSITGNGKVGLSVRVDRNTRFRRNLVKLLLALFTPLYGGLVLMLIKMAYDMINK